MQYEAVFRDPVEESVDLSTGSLLFSHSQVPALPASMAQASELVILFFGPSSLLSQRRPLVSPRFYRLSWRYWGMGLHLLGVLLASGPRALVPVCPLSCAPPCCSGVPVPLALPKVLLSLRRLHLLLASPALVLFLALLPSGLLLLPYPAFLLGALALCLSL